ncbi:MAG: autotransporter-associated beta strand repeat-containing protein [Planctomycetia bacterium]
MPKRRVAGRYHAPRESRGAVAALLIVALSAFPAFAATGTWSGGAGATWTTGTTNWSNLTGTPWDATSGPSNVAVFNTAGATPTVSGTVWVNAFTFSSTATVSGGTITLTGSVPTVTTSANATIASVLTGSAGLRKAGNSTLTFSAANTYTGTTAINGGGLTLDFSGASSPATNIVGATSVLTMGGTGAFGASSTLALNGKANTVNSQTFSGLTLNAGGAAITLTANATANPLALSIGGITRNVGASLNITQPAGTISGSNGVITTSTNTSGILGGWATVGGANWAVANAGSGITALASYTNDTWAADNNTTITGGATVADGVTTNSLRFNAAAANTLTLSGTATIASGGVLVTSAVGNNLAQITGGTLRGASGADLVVHQYNTSNGLTIGSMIVDNGGATGLTKAGGGTVTLNAANTFSGDTRVNGGTLTLGSAGALQNSTFDTQTGSVGTLSFGTLTSATFGNVEGSNALSLSGLSSFTFGGNNQTTSMSTWFSSVATSGTVTKTGTGLLTVGSVINLTGNQTLNIDGPITINSYLQMGQSGTSTINHTRGTLIANFTNGPFFIGHTNTGIYNLAGGTIDLNSGSNNKDIRLGNQVAGANGIFNMTSGTILGSSGALNIAYVAGSQGSYSQSGGAATFGTVAVGFGGSGTATATVSGGNLTVTTLNVATSGTTVSNFTLSNSGTLNLGGVATVGTGLASTGTMNLNGGRLNFTTASANITTGAGGVVNVAGGSLSNQVTGTAGGTVTVSAPMVLGAGGLTVAASSGASRWMQFNGNLSGTGGLTINIDNLNTLVLNGSNTFSGGITSNTGYFTNNSATAIPVGAAISLSGYWGLGADATIGSLTGSGLIFGGTTARVLTVGSGDVSSTFAGTMQDNNQFVKVGTGTFTLSGANTYTGGTRITAGRVVVSNTGALGAASNTLTVDGGTLDLNGRSITVGLLSGSAAGVITSGVSGAAAITLGTSGTSTFTGAITNGSGTVAVVKQNAGTMILTGSNTYGGPTTVSAGVLQFGDDSTATTFSTSGTIALAGTLKAHNGTLTLTNNRINITGASGNLTTGASGTISVSGVTFVNQAGANVAVSGPMVIGAGGLTVAASSTSSGAWVTLSGNLSGVGTVTLDSQGGNTFRLTGSNSFTGGIIASSGYWHGGLNNSIPVGSSVTNNGTWGVSGDVTVGSLSGNGGIFNIDNTTLKTVTVGSGNASSSYSGSVGSTHNLAFVKAGSGTFTLSGAWQHYGGTMINGGMLAVASTGALSGTAGSVTINGGELKYNSSTTLTRPIVFTAGTISGTGSIGTAVAVGTGDILSPGNSPGIQNYTSGLTLASGGQYTWEINNWAGSPGTGYDQLAVSGSALNITATSGTTFTIAVTGLTAGNASGAVPGFSAASGTGTSFTIATSSAGISGFDKTKFTVDTSGFTNNNTLPTSAGFWVSQSGSNLLLNYAPSATRSLSAATSAAQIIVGGTATISASVINAGVPASNPDALSFTGLSVGNGVTLGSTSGAGVTAGGTSSTSGAFTTVTAGTYTFTPGVTTATNTNIGTNALIGSTNTTTVTVLDHATSSLSGTSVVLSAVLDLGTWDYGLGTWTSGTNAGTFTISNLASLAGASLTADLSLTGYTANGGGFSTNLSNYADILGGQSSPFTITVDPSSFLTSGTQSKTFTLTMADKTGLSGGTNTNTLTVTANVVVVPEPSAAILAGMAALTAGWVAWRRRCPGARPAAPEFSA